MAKPQIGLSMLYCLGKPFKDMTKEIHKTRTARIEIVDDGLHALNKQRVMTLKNIAGSCDVGYTVHAPFAGINIALASTPLLNATLRRLKTSITNASVLNCGIWIFHPGLRSALSMFYPGMDWARNLESVRLLFRFARDHGIEAAIENTMDPLLLKGVEDFERFYNEVNEDVGLVLDTGHANLIGQVEEFLTRFPNKIAHIHAHDNLGKRDEHLGIGYGNIDWNNFARLLKKASYSRIVTIESFEHVEESMQKMKQLLM